MPIDPDVAIGAELGSTDFSWSDSDVLLYHLGIGATDLSYLARGPRPAGAAVLRRRRTDLPHDRPAAARPARLRHQPGPGRARLPVDRRHRSPADQRIGDGHHPDQRDLGQGQGRGDLAGGRRPLGRRRRAVDHPLVDLRQGRGWLGRRPRLVHARRAPRPRARHGHDVRRDAPAGAALPALRRPQPAARRPGLREGGRLPGADPARPVLLRHRAADPDRRAARGRRRPGSPGSA